MKNNFRAAHKMTREMVEKYEVDYQAQFGLCLSYLLESKEEEKEMLKNYVEEKGLKIVVENNSLNYYKDGKLVANTLGFINEGNTKESEGMILVYFDQHTGFLKEFNGITLQKETFEELLNIRTNIREAIEEYFNTLNNAKLKGLSNGSIVFSETSDLHRKLKSLNGDYFRDLERNWIRDNRKYFKQETTWEENGIGMMESTTTYTLTSKIIEKVNNEIEEYKKTEEYKSKLAKQSEYNKLYDLAETMNDEEFEDITGRQREHYRI